MYVPKTSTFYAQGGVGGKATDKYVSLNNSISHAVAWLPAQTCTGGSLLMWTHAEVKEIPP